MPRRTDQPPTPNSAEDSPESGRRRKKIRKGTTSCWECKRRKIRCTFTVAAPTAGVCDGCRRRGTTCVSQEFADAPSSSEPALPSCGVRGAGNDRLNRVEALVEQLVKDSNSKGRNDHPINHIQQLEHDISSNIDVQLPPFPAQAATGPTVSPPVTARSTTSKHDNISRSLLEAWPSTQHLDLILGHHSAIEVTGLLYKVASYTLHADFSEQHVLPQDPRDALILPPPGSHPVSIARKLLLLGIFLQYSCPHSSASPTAEKRHAIMSRVVHAATTLVINNDELVGSVEGIECIMLESLYQDTAGNIRRSWVTTRRAMVLAQMMGLPQGRAKVLESETRARFNAQHMWFRIVQSDRYLSLMLGLPQGCVESIFATPMALQGCEPVERMRRLDTVAAGRIIQRNTTHDEDIANTNDAATTTDIDMLLQKASDSIPPSWWILDISGDDQGRPFLTDADTVRLVDQVAHFNLVVQLHLPYLLRPPADQSYDYSKMAAVNASREVLTRFVMFRRVYPVGSYCRGIDFLAFIATAALSLAHLEGRRRLHSPSRAMNQNSNHSILDCLAHQRPTDRGLMERAIQSMENMATSSADVLASKLATVLRHLLTIEQDAASSNDNHYYTADISPPEQHEDTTNGAQGNQEGPSGCSGKLSEGGRVLHIHIPYYGTVKIERTNGVSKYGGGPTATPGATGHLVLPAVTQSHPYGPIQDTAADVFILDGENWSAQNLPMFDPELAACADDWTLQGVDMAFFDTLIRGTEGEQAGLEPGFVGEPWVSFGG